MNGRYKTWMITLILAGTMGGGALIVQWATAQTSTQVPMGARLSPPKGNLQRSSEIFVFKQAAESGPERGQEIYYYKCWICHNKYARSGPWLGDLYERPRLVTGAPVNDETVAAKIREGGPGMPAYRYTLADGDIADLVSYIREGKCCFDEENPPRNPRYRDETLRGTAGSAALATQARNVRGGPKGVVRESTGEPLEGIMVQLVSYRTAIRTTVYSNEDGQYEFPQLESGTYTLRVARPMEFRPYRRDDVQIDGAATLPDIVLEQMTDRLSEFLPPTPEVLSQLTGAEWMLNIPGTGQEKRIFGQACGLGCHSYQQIFRNRYDEHGWRQILNRMLRYQRATLIVPRSTEESKPENEPRANPAEEEILVKWLARVRGPESKDAPIHALSGPRGDATRVIVTEFELPRLMIAPHDIATDATGGIWYTPHRSPQVGRMDPMTGLVTEYRVPRVPVDSPVGFAHPGTHGIWVDKDGIVWMTEQIWDQPGNNFTGLDPSTGEFTQRRGFGCAVGSNDSVWTIRAGSIIQRDIRTDEIRREIPIPRARGTYNCTMSVDGNFIGGGSWPSDYTVYYDVRAGKVYEQETRTPRSMPARGGFDPKGNLWIGGRGGNLIRIDAETHRVSEYWPPTPYVTFYEAMADKNGEAWAAELHGGRIVRFNSETGKWTEYVLPEPYSHNRRAWIDNSTDPVTFWYVDHNGWMVRIQPLE